MESSELDRVELDSAERVKQAIIEAWERNNAVTIGLRFLTTDVQAGLLEFKVNFPIAIADADAAHGNEHTYVQSVKEAHIPLFNMCSEYFNEQSGHVKCHGLTDGVYLYFGQNLKGDHLDMSTDQLLLDASATIATGTARMVSESLPVNVAFTAAMVAALRAPFLVIVNTKTEKKQLSADAESAEVIMEGLAKIIGDKVFKQAKAQAEVLELVEGAARDFIRTYGVKYEARKPKTIIGADIFLPGGGKAVEPFFRIGPILTSKGRISREGVKGRGNGNGRFQAETTASGDTFINVRMHGCADMAFPIHITPGTDQTMLEIHLIAGVSSL